MRTRLYKLINPLFVLGLLLFLAGCGGSGASSTSTSTGTGAIAVKVNSQDVPVKASYDSRLLSEAGISKSAITQPDVVKVRLSVSGPGMPTISQDFPVAAGKGVIDGVPVGTERLLKVQGIDLNGIAVSSAEVKDIAVVPNQTSDVGTVTLAPVGSYTISGKITANNVGLAGVTVSTGNYSATTMTDGSYIISGVNNGSYNLSATMNGYNFLPASITVLVNNASVTAQNFTATQKTYSIKGQVTEKGTGLSGVTVSAGNYSATTQSDGSYTISNVPNGNYTITASKSGYSVTPASLQTTVNNADVTAQNFTATLIPTSFDISGVITLNGAGQSGVLVSAGSYSATSQANGSYTITGVPKGTYTLQASKSGYTYSPVSINITLSTTHLTGQNFTATANTYCISGKVTLGGAGLPDVTISATKNTSTKANVTKSVSYSATTDSDGNYTISGLTNDNYTLTPAKSEYSFTPGSIQVTINNADLSGQNFVASKLQVTVTGIVKNSTTGHAISGASVSFSGTSASTSVTTASDGSFSVSLQPGNYTFTANAPGYLANSSSFSVASSPSSQAPSSLNPVLLTPEQITPTSIVGSWKLNGSSSSGTTLVATAEFTSAGRYSRTGTTYFTDGTSTTGTATGSWTLSGTNLTITYDAGAVYNGTATGDATSFSMVSDNGWTLNYSR